jgi:hypothetical protein
LQTKPAEIGELQKMNRKGLGFPHSARGMRDIWKTLIRQATLPKPRKPLKLRTNRLIFTDKFI